MMNKILLLSVLAIGLFTACIGDDFIDDEVPAVLRITNPLQSIAKDTSVQLNHTFTNNIGLVESIDAFWNSSNPDIADVNEEGLLTAHEKGNTIISVEANYQGESLQDTFHLTVSEQTIESPQEDLRTGSLKASSFYDLEGDFTLEKEGNSLILRFESNYVADTGLPGLYVYLTNNPNSVNGAYVIGDVQVFSGEHSYELEDDIDLFEYSHVLYFCKPFNVKVGDGPLSE